MLPLQGIKILDLSWLVPGAYCTMLLGDLGADVIRIDSPSRTEVPGLTWPTKETVQYDSSGRNKKSLSLNLKIEQARRILYQLAKEADVMVEGFRPGVTSRLGVDYQTISQINPRIIYCSISGYGQDGPYHNLVGHDINYIAMAGALGLIGEKDSLPVAPLNLIADYAGGGLQAAFSILAAIIAREKTAKGQYIDIAMIDGVISLLHQIISEYFIRNKALKRGEGLIGGSLACYHTYRTKDAKYIAIGCVEPVFWQNLCHALGRDDFAPFQLDEGKKQEEIISSFQQIFLSKTRDEWFEFLKDKDTCMGKVYDLGELASDPQIRYRQMMTEIPNTQAKQVGVIPKLCDTPGKIRSVAPLPGEHTEEILSKLSYSAEQIAELRKIGAVA